MTKSIADLMRWAASKPPGYADRVLARATRRTDTEYEITEAAWAELSAEMLAELRPKRSLPIQPQRVSFGEIPEGWSPEDVKAGRDSKGSDGCGC